MAVGLDTWMVDSLETSLVAWTAEEMVVERVALKEMMSAV